MEKSNQTGFSPRFLNSDLRCRVCGKLLSRAGKVYRKFWITPRGPVCEDCADGIRHFLPLAVVQSRGKIYRVFFQAAPDTRAFVFEKAGMPRETFLIGWFKTKMVGWISVGKFSLLHKLGLPEISRPDGNRPSLIFSDQMRGKETSLA